MRKRPCCSRSGAVAVGVALLVGIAACGSGAAAPSGAGGGGQTGGGGGAGATGGTGGHSAGAGGAGGATAGAPGAGGTAGGGGAPVSTPDSGGAIPADAATDAPAADAAAGPDAAGAAEAGAPPAGAVVWAVDNLQSIGGHRTTVLGAPMVIETPAGKALQFDGDDDALFVDHHPLARMPQFTVELYFRPDAGGSPAQRFFHMQDDATGGRVLFETRLPGGNSWVLDVFIESTAGEVAVYDARKTHPLGAWYHLAAVVDGQRARSYVNGVEQVSFPLAFRPHQGGRTSIGVRITRMYFFKGAIRQARFTPRVLTPAEFLPPPP
jgi:hypothetical protein